VFDSDIELLLRVLYRDEVNIVFGVVVGFDCSDDVLELEAIVPIDGSDDDDVSRLDELTVGLTVLLLSDFEDTVETSMLLEEVLIVVSVKDEVTDFVLVEGGPTVLDIVLYTVENVVFDWLTVVGVTVGIEGILVLDDVSMLDEDTDDTVVFRSVGSVITVPVVLDIEDIVVIDGNSVADVSDDFDLSVSESELTEPVVGN
jgi:hypothetical protein